ncbi:MAG: FAD-dependent monooxygenase [Acidobacteria bacterium]|nr:FAD-dependent monooxygenase [Acidobacteriota bacterium]
MSVVKNPDGNRVETNHSVAIAGGGPTGLRLAGELALAGINVAIIERRENQDLAGLRAGGLYPRTLESLDQRGIVGRFISQGQIFHKAPFAHIALDTSDLPSRHNYFLAIWQTHIERILLGWVTELAVPIYRAREVVGFAQDSTGVDVEMSDGQSLRVEYLVGCDGGRSAIRKLAGIDFAGWDATTSYLIAEIETDTEPEWGIRRSAKGINAIAKLDDGKRARTVLTEKNLHQKLDETSPGQNSEPTLSDVRRALIDVYATDFGLRKADYISRFTDMTRQAVSYRDRRVFLAGDAAHVHSPVGGQGLNLGVQDSVNLGWKLAQVIHGTSPEILLDTYHSERHPVGARVLRTTMALSALERADVRIDALRETMCELFQLAATRDQYLAMKSALDIRYDFGEGHPLLGRRMPDLDVLTATGEQRVFTFLHQAKPVLISFAESAAIDLAPWASRIQRVDAKFEGKWVLPVIGEVPAPTAVLVRPDGYVAWVGEASAPQSGLSEALTQWFGPGATA